MVNLKNCEFVAVFKQVVTAAKPYGLRCLPLTFSILFGSLTPIFGQDLAVGLRNGDRINSLMFSPTNGTYHLLGLNGDTLYQFRSDDALSISVVGEMLLLKSPYGLNDTVPSVQLMGTGNSRTFKARFNGEGQDHFYFDRLMVVPANGGLRVVNQVNIERYAGKVVQAEVGHGANDEYYKIQSIICRTYAVKHLGRHTAEGFDLCDNEHCQVYSGLKTASDEVVKATAATSGLVMVDPDNKLVLSAFHANCGGQTANSEGVWKESRSYLSSVRDTFCTKGRSAEWEKTMKVDELLTQLGFSTDSSESNGWNYLQTERKKHFVLNEDSVETVKMRRLLQLRSTFFDLSVKDGVVNFTGRGYGHGVGLCQQGAMKMAEAGYTYSQILGYYYKGVSLIPATSLQPEK